MSICRLYARVSTTEQEEKYGLEAQLFELRAYAAKMGYSVASEYHDAISGENDTRPALDKLIAEAKAGEMVLLHHRAAV
jgi:DNA invertase Pin-like site-specific DNA recombinase